MEVILFDDVKDLGRQGDVVKVAPGYFRNFLSPKGLAAEATPANRHRFEKMKKKQQELAAARLADAQALAKKIEGITVTVKAKAGETERLFGSVTQHDIAEALAAAGYHVDKRHIILEEHIKQLGLFTVGVQIHPQVEGKIRVLVERA
ncbi:MAG: 50S ribosomal protein L9 [Candidatus Sumerlaeaceae bacterium]|nr:50S ribosomal protein L9 [Candidatus Sumerlaeaceae bacterium]